MDEYQRLGMDLPAAIEQSKELRSWPARTVPVVSKAAAQVSHEVEVARQNQVAFSELEAMMKGVQTR